jgi:hypothetical protein
MIITYRDRNRAIKQDLERVYGRGNVHVKHSHGTGYDHLHVEIVHATRDHAHGRELESEIKQRIATVTAALGCEPQRSSPMVSVYFVTKQDWADDRRYQQATTAAERAAILTEISARNPE